ncbi:MULTISPECIES: DUF4148 domain-containing protein [Burkholderiaceae]|jgi:Domain of unknown function (DUF4148)|uniref:Purine nucleoside phosphorylase n=1 Tax=Caballeronia sordidicola TaxID=196367 RepID=A0A242MAY5_CABSO|nr:DUF4148 domain-containing protein [Caballeronia sordidicola]OTP68445.1 hypothetical protein PAMC26577_34065 [Caballeronia sordidicola]
MIKSLIPAVVIASALAAPALAFAQDNTQVTRSAVKSDLQQMEQAGYTPAEDRTTYPAKTQAAEQRVQDERGVAATSYGPSMSGTSASGIRAQTGPSDSNHTIYFGH